jgi:copper chaperone
MKEVTIKVEGMSCGHCVKAVESAISGLPGVKVNQVIVGQARVGLDEGSPVGPVIDAIEDAGYTAQELPA